MNYFKLSVLGLLSSILLSSWQRPANSQILVRLSHGFGSQYEWGSEPTGVYNFDEGALHLAYGSSGICGAYTTGHSFSVDNRMEVGVRVRADYSESHTPDPTYMIYRLNADGSKTKVTTESPCGEDDQDDIYESDVHDLSVGNYVIYAENLNGGAMGYDIDLFECEQRFDNCVEFDD
ncbi:MAG: hypothetical protein AAFN40_23215 [Cyanobacteria bacterium J06560_6]